MPSSLPAVIKLMEFPSITGMRGIMRSIAEAPAATGRQTLSPSPPHRIQVSHGCATPSIVVSVRWRVASNSRRSRVRPRMPRYKLVRQPAPMVAKELIIGNVILWGAAGVLKAPWAHMGLRKAVSWIAPAVLRTSCLLEKINLVTCHAAVTNI